MLDLIVFIKCSGVNAREDNLFDTICSFKEKNRKENYKFYIVADPIMEKGLSTIVDSLGIKDKILDIKITENSWAYDFNIFLDKHGDDSRWLLISHDDVVYVTDNYFSEMTKNLGQNLEKVGWITSTSEYYYKYEKKLTTDTFRPGFHLDHHKWGKGMFQLHRGDLNSIDYPESPVKIHGPMSAVMLIPMNSMRKIGYCEDWTRYTMLVDEDWSLSALKEGLWNLWVPAAQHLHPNRKNLRKANNRWMDDAHTGMLNKWGFDVGNPITTGWQQGVSIDIEELREVYKNTNIPWSSYRNSYDWDYWHG